ncbi:hypothetical protein Tco_0821023 [Tanacetum coccineum]|uniref:Uncharacterized protein n=1 Tax=Tanacetum coccineum TaxID=301880 RepID=A0ABQ5ACT3_9ASTR
MLNAIQSEEATIAKDVEANHKRFNKELEKQDIATITELLYGERAMKHWYMWAKKALQDFVKARNLFVCMLLRSVDTFARFDVVHKVFNASNVGNMLQVLARRELTRMMLTGRIQVAIFFKLLPCISSSDFSERHSREHLSASSHGDHDQVFRMEGFVEERGDHGGSERIAKMTPIEMYV